MSVAYFKDIPTLRDPLFVMAFAGWNDAAESATSAARYLVENLNGELFARIQSEDYFQFSDQRPTIKRDDGGRREITWSSNEFYFCRSSDIARDLVVGVGVEPHLKWKRFGRDVLEIGRFCRVGLIVTMGALLAGELHSAPSKLVAIATDPSLVEPAGVEITPYEGPTGIVGVIHTLMQDEGLPAVSLWANVPHYIASLPNPKATLALLDRLGVVGDFKISLQELERSVKGFDEQVQSAIARDPRISRYVNDLQKGKIPENLLFGGSSEGTGELEEIADELPPGNQVADEIERLLRRRQGGSDSE